MKEDIQLTLAEVLEKYHIEVPESQRTQMERFCMLLWDWNEKINLTRHTTYEKFVTRDLLDTMALSEFLASGERVLDVGSGNGVPGILLGILRPDISVALVECVGKKAKVLADIIHDLQLPIPVYAALGQDILGQWQFHTLTFRAVASVKKILEWFHDSWSNFDRMLLVKGPRWIEERGEARHYGFMHGLALRKLKEYSIPGVAAEMDSSADLGPGMPLETAENVKEDNNESWEHISELMDSASVEGTGHYEECTAEAAALDVAGQSVILQICQNEKLGENDLCTLTAWETGKSRHRSGKTRRKTHLD